MTYDLIPGEEDSASMKGNRTDNHTVSPDIMMETQIKFHGMYEHIYLSGPLLATYQDHGIIRGLNSATPSLIVSAPVKLMNFTSKDPSMDQRTLLQTGPCVQNPIYMCNSGLNISIKELSITISRSLLDSTIKVPEEITKKSRIK